MKRRLVLISNFHSKIYLSIILFVTLISAEVIKKQIDIIGKIPHSRKSFTQGLLYENGKLFESTGAPDNRSSEVLLIGSADGTVIKRNKVPNVFAEGLTLLNNKLTLLTWRSQIAFQMNKESFNTENQLQYIGEGWGLTDDGSVFIMSNGSDSLFIRDLNFNIIGKVAVTYKGDPLFKINELEFVNGVIFANVWYSDFIYEIDISTGNVVSKIDCSILRAKCTNIDKHNVLNGIAYDRNNDLFYLTGKDWPWIFKVKFSK